MKTLDVETSRTVLRVRHVLPHGILELEGADGMAVKVRMEPCAPCYIPNLITDELGMPADIPIDSLGLNFARIMEGSYTIF